MAAGLIKKQMYEIILSLLHCTEAKYILSIGGYNMKSTRLFAMAAAFLAATLFTTTASACFVSDLFKPKPTTTTESQK